MQFGPYNGGLFNGDEKEYENFFFKKVNFDTL